MNTNRFDILNSADEQTIEALAQKTNLSKAQKDRIFSASMEKFKKAEASGEESFDKAYEPSQTADKKIKVRRYAPIISAAACLAVVIGATGIMLALRNKGTDTFDSSSVKTSSSLISADAADTVSSQAGRIIVNPAESSEEVSETESKPTESSEAEKKETQSMPEKPNEQVTVTDNTQTQDNTEQSSEEQHTEEQPSQEKQPDNTKPDNDHPTGVIEDDWLTNDYIASIIELKYALEEIQRITNQGISVDYSVYYDSNFEPIPDEEYPESGYVLVNDAQFNSISAIEEYRSYISSKMTGDTAKKYLSMLDDFTEHNGKLYYYSRGETGNYWQYDWSDRDNGDWEHKKDMKSVNFVKADKTSCTFEEPYTVLNGKTKCTATVSCVLENGIWKISTVKDEYVS